jgi:hypothetical protein
MNSRKRLAQNLTSETKAYGYTLTIWSSGSLLSAFYGPPTITEIFLFVFGALTGFGALTALAFRELFTDVEAGGTQEVMAASMIHFIATGGTLLLNYLFVSLVGDVGSAGTATFAIVGFLATVEYNAFLLAEEYTARLATYVADGAEATQG